MRGNNPQLKWCLKQRRGIRLVRPSDNLLRAYLKKAESALRSMDVNAKAGIAEWAVSAGYYARYFAVYGLFQKVGIKCEIHDCTIALFEHLFQESVSRDLIEELRQSKDYRIEIQYYSTHLEVDLDEVIDKTRAFVLEIEKMIDALNPSKILVLQKKLRALSSSLRSH